MVLSSQVANCVCAAEQVVRMDTHRITLTLAVYIFGKCGQEGRRVPVVILWLRGLRDPRRSNAIPTR